MATGVFGLSSACVAVGVLLCLVGGGWARSLTEDAEFICSGSPKGSNGQLTTQTKPCDDGHIGEAYATEAFGNPLRKLLTTYYVMSGSPYGGRSSPFRGSSPHGSSRYGSSPHGSSQYGSSPYRSSQYGSSPYQSSQQGSSPYGGSSGPSSSFGDNRGSPFGGSTQNSAPSGGYPSGGGGGAGCSDTDSSVQAVIACTNAVRQNPEAYQYPCSTPWLSEYTRQRRGPLGINGALMNAAQGHSDYQASTGRMTHSGPGGNSVGTRVRQAGYSWRAVAENVAMGQTSAKQVVLDWMCSSGHRRNMMNCRYSDLGVGVNCNGRCFYTQDFGCSGSCGCSGGAPSAGGSPYSGGAPSGGSQYGGSRYGGSPVGSDSGFGQRSASPNGPQYSTSNGSPYDRRSTSQPQYEQPRQSTSTRNPFEQSQQSTSDIPWWVSEMSSPQHQGRPSFFSQSTPTHSSPNSARDSSRSSSSDPSSRFKDFFTFSR